MTAATKESRKPRREQAEPDGATAKGSTASMPIDQIKVEDRWAQYFSVSEDECELLKTSIAEEGIREPLVITPDRVLLDGHRRLAVARELGFSDVPVVEREFSDDEAIEVFILTTQLQRRNLTDAQRADLRGRLYNRLKAARGGDHRSKDHGEPLVDAAEMVANASGVSKSTVKRDGRYSRAVDKAAKKGGPTAKAKMLAGKPKRDVVPRIEAAESAEEIEAALLGRCGETPSSGAETVVPHDEAPPEAPAPGHGEAGSAWDFRRGWGPKMQGLQQELTSDWRSAANADKVASLIDSVTIVVEHRLRMCDKEAVPGEELHRWMATVAPAAQKLQDAVAARS